MFDSVHANVVKSPAE